MTCTFDLTKCFSLTYGRDLPDELVLTFTDELAAPVDLTGITVTAQVFNTNSSKVLANFTAISVVPLLGQVGLSTLSWVKKPTAGEANGWLLLFDGRPRLRGNVNIYAY